MNIVMFKQDTQNHVFTKLDLIIRSRTNELRSNFWSQIIEKYNLLGKIILWGGKLWYQFSAYALFFFTPIFPVYS